MGYINQDGIESRLTHPTKTIPGPWMQVSGDEAEREVTKRKPGVGEDDVLKPSKLVHSDVTLVKMFNPETDLPFIRAIDAGDTFAGSSLANIYRDLDGNAIPGATRTSTNCLVKSYSMPEGDANGTDDAVLTIVVSRAGAA